MRAARRRTPLVVAALGLCLTVGGCSLLGGGGRSAQDEADELARALSSGRLGSLAWTGGTAAQAQALYARTTSGLGVDPRVSVSSVEDGGDAPSTARLTWSWRLAGTRTPWTYRSTARLVQGSGTVDDGWQVRLAPSLLHPDLRASERMVRSTRLGRRGDILGAGGTPLVQERPVVRVGVDRSKVPAGGLRAASRKVAQAVDVAPQPFYERVRAAGPRAFVEAIVLRRADATQQIRLAVQAVRGGALVSGTLPLAPTRDFARAVLGTVGPVTAEVVEKSGGVYAAGDQAGLSGLEARYDVELRGAPGVRVSAVGGTGDGDGATRELLSTDPVDGTALRTTLDVRLQRAAEGALADLGPASALVAVRPSTGDLLAVASGPGSEGYSTATLGHYAPGSTFKVVSSLALLRAGLTPTSTVDCPAERVVDGKRFTNYSDYPAGALGSITLATAVANSCNTAFVGERDRVGQDDLADAAASLGLGVDHDLGLPAYFGSVPATATDAGGETGHAASMIGQGRVLASPMAMAAVAASVSTGATVVPRLLVDPPAAGTSESSSPSPSSAPSSGAGVEPLTVAEARALRTLMRGVVTRGSGRFLAGIPGAPVLAKTGTAEFGEDTPPQTHAWMIAVHGDLAVAVFVDLGDSGSGTAGPDLERFLRAAG